MAKAEEAEREKIREEIEKERAQLKKEGGGSGAAL